MSFCEVTLTVKRAEYINDIIKREKWISMKARFMFMCFCREKVSGLSGCV